MGRAVRPRGCHPVHEGSKTLGLEAGAYARVEHVNAKENVLTVARPDGEPVTYDPRRLQGVTVYREADRALAAGDRVQFTAPDRERHVANRELGTIESIEIGGQTRVRLDSGRHVSVKAGEPHHLDHGYAVTSHSSQGQTADRVLVHVDTEPGERLVNQRLAYVAISRSVRRRALHERREQARGRAGARRLAPIGVGAKHGVPNSHRSP
jgi:ATP-dependent exoDNAse (exonuclease V) alpha subunit